MSIETNNYGDSLKSLESNLEESFSDLLLNYRAYFNEVVIEETHALPGITPDDVEKNIEEYLMSPLKNALKKNTRMLVERVSSAIEHANTHEGKESTLAELLLREVPSHYRGTDIDFIYDRFLKQIPSFIIKSVDIAPSEFRGLPAKTEAAKDRIKSSLSSRINGLIVGLKNTMKESVEEFYNSISKNETYRADFSSKESKVNFNYEDIANGKILESFTNYRLDDGSFVNIKTNESFPIKKTGDKVFTSYDGNLEFSYQNNEWVWKEFNKVMTVGPNFVAIGGKNNPKEQEILYGYDKIKFIYNGIIVDNPNIINHICESFKTKCSKLYEANLAGNPIFREVEEENAIKAVESAIITTTSEGKSTINPTNKDILEKYLQSIGYTLSLEENTIYLTDANGIKEEAALEGNKLQTESGVVIEPDSYTFPQNAEATGPVFRYKNPEIGVSIDIGENFNYLYVTTPGGFYCLHIDGANLKARGFAGSDNKDRKYTTDFNQITGVISLYAREALKNILKVYRENEKRILSFNFGEEDREVMSDEVISELETKLESDASNLSTSTFNTEPDAYVKLVEEIDLDEAKQQVTYITPEQVDERLAELSSNPYVQEYLDLIGQKKDYEDESESLGGSLGPIL